MTEEEAREELKQYRYDKAIERKRLEMLEELKTDCMKMTSVITDMPHAATPNVHKIEEKYIRYLDAQNEVLGIMNANMVKMLQITKKIQQIEQPYRNILELKYIEGLKLWEIQDVLNCGRRTMDRLYKTAIEKYAFL